MSDVHDDAEHPGKAHAGPDAPAAFIGLIVGAFLLFVVLYSVVSITNAHYDAIEKAAAPAATS
jgi:hypothetical protein